MFASHYVIQHIYILFEKEDLEGTKALFDKFTSRYPTDNELEEISQRFITALDEENTEEINNIKKDLKTLLDTRRFEETSGGVSPTSSLKSRRPGIDTWIRLV
ncbi:MAG: hypothetical protein B6U97_01475 [Candidatus Altiarchaeales archaeon ex4484_96]|nr:MAG: hypothetical protein B6U97_01475 [Candidatus Altiarchaeales archaeon ex4484_96]